MKPAPGSWIEIDGEAFHANLQALAGELAPTPMALVVKAGAYGHGVEAIVPLALEAGCTEFAVFSSHEAANVRAVAPQATIQVMGHTGRDWDWLARHNVEAWLSDVAEWPLAQKAARRHLDRGGSALRIHLEVETGMHRTGLVPDNALRILTEAQEEPGIEVRGVCTHLAGVEAGPEDARIQAQVATFEALETAIDEAGLPMPVRHIASSSAALLVPAWRKDLVRVGIACYGMWPTPLVRARFEARRGGALHLRRVLTWRSRVMAVQDVPAGEFVGYGRSFRAPRDTRIAVVPVGYGDGLTRRLSNAGALLVRGTRCPIVGPVNMNMVQVDVGRLDGVEPGEDVVLIGQQGDQEIGVHSFAEAQEVVDYELMARLDADLPRIVMPPPLAPGH